MSKCWFLKIENKSFELLPTLVQWEGQGIVRVVVVFPVVVIIIIIIIIVDVVLVQKMDEIK